MFKKVIWSFLFLLMFISGLFAQKAKTISAETVLQKVSAKLNSLQTIKYKYHQEYNYASEAYFAESNADTFLEFSTLEEIIGVKFQFRNDSAFIAYNGSEYFQLNEKDKTIKVEPKPKIERLGSSSYLQLSPLMLRNALPKIMADKTITKTINETKINDKSFYLIEFILDKSYLDGAFGSVLPMTINRKTVYRLTIDKQTFFPLEIYRGNNLNKDFNKTTFSEIVENPKPPTENSWFYSTYLPEYKFAEEPKNNLIKIGQTAFDINLPMFTTDKLTALSDYKGKVVLLDFWIFHCGACQEGVPKLNALQKKYKKKDFKLLTVNAADSEKLIKLFIKKTKPEFPILYNGEEIAAKYGVFFYPTVVLLGKEGTVIYAGEFDQTKIEELINRNL